MDKNIEIDNYEINTVLENIKIVENHIEEFKRKKPLFFQKNKMAKYNKRIENLEYIKKCFYETLEYKMDKDNM